MSYNTENVLMVCLLGIVFFLGLFFTIYQCHLNSINESPYNKCVDYCNINMYRDQALDCLSKCNDDFKWIVNETMNTLNNILIFERDEGK